MYKRQAQILEVQEYPDDALCFAETADYDGDGKKETFAAIGRYDGAFGAPVCDLWFVGADGAVLEEENFAFKELEKLGSAFVLYRGYEVSGVSDMLSVSYTHLLEQGFGQRRAEGQPGTENCPERKYGPKHRTAPAF